MGSWADEFAALLYRLPGTFDYRWIRDGAQVSAPVSSSVFFPSVPGDYSCGVRGSNPVGSVEQLSPPRTVSEALTLGKAKLNKKRGTAALSVSAGAAGALRLSGKNLVTQGATAGSPGTVKLLVKTKGASKKKLNSEGKLSVKVTVTFTPSGGQSSSSTKTVKLKKSSV